MKYLCIALVLMAGCSTTMQIKDASGNVIVSSSSGNGSISASHGLGCTPAVPNAGVLAPAAPVSPAPAPVAMTWAPQTMRDVNGRPFTVMMAQPVSAPIAGCDTTVVTTRGTDTSTYAAWAAGLMAVVKVLFF